MCLSCHAAEAEGVAFSPIGWMNALSLIQTLSPEQIAVTAAYYFDGLTEDEIAAKRGSTRQAVHKLLEKARNKLTRFGHQMPEPRRHDTKHIRQVDDRLMRSL